MQLLTARIALVCGFAGLAPGVAAAQLATAQLGDNMALAERQAALARVPPGEIIRMRLADGGRAGGPIVRWTAYTVTLGPYLGYAERDTFVALAAIDTMWFRGRATHRGALFGGIAGGAVGVAIGASASSLCPTGGASKESCAQGAVTSGVAGVLLGGLIGAVVGSGTPDWHRLHPWDRGGRSAPPGTPVTLIAPGDSSVPDPRTLALARIRPGTLARLTFGDRPDLAGYVVVAGAHRATLAATVGPVSGEPVSLASLDAIWQRGTAARGGSVVGMLLGAAAGTYVAASTSACDPGNHCTGAIAADGLIGGMLGWLLGGRVGSAFPKWERRF
ncbi:MAG TPA: hypothetical protein VGJ83_01145 [Gemmatimonadales bacterium]